MGDSVKSHAEVEVDNIHCSPLVFPAHPLTCCQCQGYLSSPSVPQSVKQQLPPAEACH